MDKITFSSVDFQNMLHHQEDYKVVLQRALRRHGYHHPTVNGNRVYMSEGIFEIVGGYNQKRFNRIESYFKVHRLRRLFRATPSVTIKRWNT